MAINSKQKGKKGELEFSNFCKERGYNTRRTAQYNGKENGSLADIIGIDGYHIEVKRVEKLNIDKAYEQAERDKKETEIPIVAHRRNRKKWLITLSAEDFFNILELIEKGNKKDGKTSK